MRRTALATVITFLLVASRAHAQPWGPGGAELRVNTYTTGVQYGSSVASDVSEGFLVSWVSINEDGDLNGIYARRFSFAGPLDVPFRVNTETAGNQTRLAAGGSQGPQYVVLWDGPGDGDGIGVTGQFADGNGPLGSELRMNAITTQNESHAAVSADNAGRFVAVWHGTGDGDTISSAVSAQRFDSAGRLGPGFRVNTYIDGPQDYPAVGMSHFGEFVVAWTSLGQEGSGRSVFAQRFDTQGVAVGPEFRVNTTFGVTQGRPAVAMGDSGFVIAWHKTVVDILDADVQAQRFEFNGAPLGAEFRVNTFTTGYQWLVKGAVEVNAGFVLVWEDRGGADGSQFGVMAQRFGDDGTPLGREFAVSASTAGDQRSPSIAMNGKNDFVVSYTVTDGPASSEIRARVFCNKLAGDANGDDKIDVTDVLYLINHLFAGGPSPIHDGDADGSDSVNVSDVLFLINHLFGGGPAPACAPLS